MIPPLVRFFKAPDQILCCRVVFGHSQALQFFNHLAGNAYRLAKICQQAVEDFGG